MGTILDDLESKACANLSCPVTFRRPHEVIPVSRTSRETRHQLVVAPISGPKRNTMGIEAGRDAGRIVKIPKIK